MESFVLDLSMSGDCGVTNSQGIEPFSCFGYLFCLLCHRTSTYEYCLREYSKLLCLFIGLLITSVKLNLKRIPPHSYFNKAKRKLTLLLMVLVPLYLYQHKNHLLLLGSNHYMYLGLFELFCYLLST